MLKKTQWLYFAIINYETDCQCLIVLGVNDTSIIEESFCVVSRRKLEKR